jgi:hypothetical protein
VALIGDSHIRQYWPRFTRLTEQLVSDRTRVVLLARSGCPALPGVERRRLARGCPAAFDSALRFAARPEVSMVVIGSYWEGYLQGTCGNPSGRPLTGGLVAAGGVQGTAPLSRAGRREVFEQLALRLSELRRAGKQVVILLSNPAGASVHPGRALDRFTLAPRAVRAVRRAEYAACIAPVVDELREVARTSGARLVDPLDFLCAREMCPVQSADGLPLYRDEDHVFATFAARIALMDTVLWGGSVTARRQGTMAASAAANPR